MVLKAFAGIQLPGRGPKLLRTRPLIAEIETMLEDRSMAWAPTFQPKCDAASLALFGVTEAEVRPKEPHPDDIKDDSPTARFWFSDDAFKTYGAAMDAWVRFNQRMRGYERESEESGPAAYWRSHGYDVTDGYGTELRCLPHFERQLYVAVMGLLPGARVTLDGTGKRATQSTEDWGAALAAQAAKFKPTR